MTELDPPLAHLLSRSTETQPDTGPRERRMLYRILLQHAASLVPRVEVAAVQDIQLEGGAGPMKARVYRPRGPGPFATIVFFHGGGFVIGDVEAYDFQCRTLCREVGAVVLSVDYRLAPEAPFPAAVEDALAATRWAGLNIATLGGDPHRLAVAGDSAGGTLAAVATQSLRESGPRLAAQLLLYPGTDWLNAFPSQERNGRGKLLTAADMEWFSAQYLPDASLRSDPRVSPALASSFAGLPPAVVATAEHDPLVDDGDAYAVKLRAAGNRVVHRRFDGITHVFFGLGPISPACAEATRLVCADVRELLG